MATNKKDKPEMTNQQIIAAIENDLKWHSKELQPKYKEALRQTIEKLNELEKYQQIGTIEEFQNLKNTTLDEDIER